MRIRERIPNFLYKVNPEFLHKLFLKWFKTNFEEVELRICKDKRKIKKFWMANHDLRFSQVLIAMGYLENFPGTWFYDEDENVLLEAGYPPRECLFWGQRYDKDMNMLPEVRWILIKDMTTDHIKAVIAFMGERLPQRYKNAFQAELELRNVG